MYFRIRWVNCFSVNFMNTRTVAFSVMSPVVLSVTLPVGARLPIGATTAARFRAAA